MKSKDHVRGNSDRAKAEVISLADILVNFLTA